MALLIELPTALEEELKLEAGQVGVSASVQASFLLQLMSAFTREGKMTPFRSAVQAYLRQNSLDADRLADVVDRLIDYCLRESGRSLMPGPTDRISLDGMDPEAALSMLRDWQGQMANRPTDQDPVISVREIPPVSQLVPREGRPTAHSLLGKYAHLGGGSEEFMREKQLELDREDRRR